MAILTDRLFFYVPKFHRLVEKFLVLAERSIFLYNDRKAYKRHPDKPITLVPLAEITGFC